jgi:hypothetical protein
MQARLTASRTHWIIASRDLAKDPEQRLEAPQPFIDFYFLPDKLLELR